MGRVLRPTDLARPKMNTRRYTFWAFSHRVTRRASGAALWFVDGGRLDQFEAGANFLNYTSRGVVVVVVVVVVVAGRSANLWDASAAAGASLC